MWFWYRDLSDLHDGTFPLQIQVDHKSDIVFTSYLLRPGIHLFVHCKDQRIWPLVFFNEVSHSEDVRLINDYQKLFNFLNLLPHILTDRAPLYIDLLLQQSDLNLQSVLQQKVPVYPHVCIIRTILYTLSILFMAAESIAVIDRLFTFRGYSLLSF